jgi:hypothetical protein
MMGVFFVLVVKDSAPLLAPGDSVGVADQARQRDKLKRAAYPMCLLETDANAN